MRSESKNGTDYGKLILKVMKAAGKIGLLNKRSQALKIPLHLQNIIYIWGNEMNECPSCGGLAGFPMSAEDHGRGCTYYEMIAALMKLIDEMNFDYPRDCND